MKQIIKPYLEKYSTLNNSALARKIAKEKGLDVENVRSVIRYWRGKTGIHKKNNLSDQSFITPPSNCKILIFDIETLPIIAATWGVWKQNINRKFILKDWCVLSWSAKWLYSPETLGDVMTPTEARNRNDKRIIKGIWDLINEADVLIAHNGDKFDMPRLTSRFLIHKFNPPMPYQMIDTLKTLRRMGNTYNRLDWINEQLGLQCKLPMEANDWILCDNGDKDALDKMLKYNIEDTKILEEMYLVLRPWIRSHPNLGLFDGKLIDSCPTCNSENIKWTGDFYHTLVAKYSVFRCNDCGAPGRSRYTAIDKKKKRYLNSPTIR